MDWIAELIAIDTTTWAIALWSAAIVGLLLGALPVGAAEAIALAAGAIPSVHMRIGVILMFTTGHVIGKALWYYLGTLESRVSGVRLRAWIERGRTVATKHPTLGFGVMAASALASVPPFHLIAVAAGLLHTPPVPFFAISFAGRLVRFGTLAAFPSLVRSLFT